MLIKDIVIILCRPGGGGNTGAVCRAMKNMGLSTLRIVGTPRDSLDGEELLNRAVHARDIWERTAFFDSLEKAAEDCAFLAGTTRRRGRLRKRISLEPRELAVWLRDKQGKAGIVFGSERTGLEDRELEICNAASHIPSSGAFPSLNLSHAVQIYAYEFFRTLGPEPAGQAVKGAWVPMNRGEAGELAASISGVFASLGFYRHPGREVQEQFLADLISRAGLTRSEGHYLVDLFAKAARLGAFPPGPAKTAE
jgi:tRNA/rRNA methyltransferase/tRNA (cytidine32/uridine32-2'-O)-methyltransferase